MIIHKSDLENMVRRFNISRGYINPQYLTVGVYRLCRENGGYCVREVVNKSGGLRTVGNVYGMTARECYFFLSGLIEGVSIV